MPGIFFYLDRMIMKREISGLYLKDQLIFDGLNEQQLYTVFSASRQHILRKNTRLYINSIQSNRVYLLVKGKMKLVNTGIDDGNTVKDIIYPGDLFGNISLNGFRGEEIAEALVQNTIVYCFGVDEFSNLLKVNHRMALNYASVISS
jgi:signal-transduction protein with cAMP-binding, CBS, and nucleotidyltransferase domain